MKALVVVVLCLACLMGLGLAQPASAWAADYRCSKADMTAQVETDGTITVVDQRVFEFSADEDAAAEASSETAEEDAASSADDGANSEAAGADDAAKKSQGETGADSPNATAARHTLKWLYDGFNEDAEITIKRVRMASVDAEGNVTDKWTKLKSITFLLSWRDGGGPEKDAWSYDKYRSTLYAFVTTGAPRVVVEVTYEVHYGVVAYDDAADLSWSFASRNYSVDMHNVTAEVILPVPADATVKPGENVRAWGHGPADGTVDIGKDGTVIFSDPLVHAGAYALGRVMFPVEWLTNLPDDIRLAHQGSHQYVYTTRYEEGWVDSESFQKMTRDALRAALLSLCVVLLVAGVAVYAWRGRQKPPAFTDDYWDDVPDASLEPAVMGRLWRWNHVSCDDVAATLVDMVRRGAVAWECSGDGAFALRFDAADTAERLALADADGARDQADARSALDASTRQLLSLIADGSSRLPVTQIGDFARRNPGTFLRAINAWQQELTSLVESYEFFDQKSRRAQRIMLVAAGVLVLLAIAAFIGLGWGVALLTLASAAALGVLANYTTRRSTQGNEITAHAKALRNWIRDGGMQEAAPQVELIPYALLFNVLSEVPPCHLAECADEVTRALNDAWRVASRRAEVAGSTGEAPADQGVEPHWRPFWRRPKPVDEPIDDDF